MEADIDGIVLGIGDGRAIIEGRVLIGIPGDDDVESLAFEFAARGLSHQQDQILLDAARAASTRIRAPVGGIDHDGTEDMLWRWRSLRWCGLRWGRRAGCRGLRWLRCGLLRGLLRRRLLARLLRERS